MDWETYRANTAAQILQGMLETENTWLKRLWDDAEYKQIAHHAVKLTDCLIKRLQDFHD